MLGAKVLGAQCTSRIVGMLGAPIAATAKGDYDMAGVKRFEDLVCWQLANELNDLVFALIKKGNAARDRDFCDQIARAASKVAPQIAEGFARYTPKDTANYLRIAKASLAEVQSHLHTAQRREYFSSEDHARVELLAKRTQGATTAFLRTRIEAARRQAESKHRRSVRT